MTENKNQLNTLDKNDYYRYKKSDIFFTSEVKRQKYSRSMIQRKSKPFKENSTFIPKYAKYPKNY